MDGRRRWDWDRGSKTKHGNQLSGRGIYSFGYPIWDVKACARKCYFKGNTLLNQTFQGADRAATGPGFAGAGAISILMRKLKVDCLPVDRTAYQVENPG
jgi:hypothetical protein